MTEIMTQGCHHIGLTVSRLEESAAFFTGLLDWQEVRRDRDYPAIFVSDGSIMLTLWQVQTDKPNEFDKNINVGLHHLALAVANKASLHALHERLEAAGVRIEFSPELLRDGPAMHMMCYEPSGIRIELIWPGK